MKPSRVGGINVGFIIHPINDIGHLLHTKISGTYWKIGICWCIHFLKLLYQIATNVTA